MRHAISMKHMRASIQGRNTSLLYAAAKPELDPQVAAQERSNRRRPGDRQERIFQRQDNTFLE